jgi:cytochrome o ubiquinol oxidase subunit 3
MKHEILADGETPTLWHHGYAPHDAIATKTFGFWLYMLSDALIFAGIFAAYGVLDHAMNAAGGPTEAQVVHPIAAFIQTIVVLTSVFAYSLATVALKAGNKTWLTIGIIIAALLGALFVALELRDFGDLYVHGATAQTSGFLAAFFLIIATHGLHMLFGILWLLVMLVQVRTIGLTAPVVAQLLNLRLFWQFQAAVWVCVYVFVYLKGAIPS